MIIPWVGKLPMTVVVRLLAASRRMNSIFHISKEGTTSCCHMSRQARETSSTQPASPGNAWFTHLSPLVFELNLGAYATLMVKLFLLRRIASTG